MDKTATVGNWTVEVDIISGEGRWTNGLIGGELYFYLGELEDFDGAFALPEDVIRAILQIGYKADKELFCA